MDLRAASIIDPWIEGHYAFFPKVEQISTREHFHDFFEAFLIVSGGIHHHINGEIVPLSRGDLVFIRPDDTHFFSRKDEQNCELLNLAFLRSVFGELMQFMRLESSAMLEPKLPPSVTLNAAERTFLVAHLKKWGRMIYQDKIQARLGLRSLLVQIISHVQTAGREDLEAIPDWLKDVCQQMQQREYVLEGRVALMRLANRSSEHVGRAFRLHLGVTPSEYINNLRLEIALDLLLHTDTSIIDICFDTGFGNLSHFYHRFKARFQCTPTQFRKLHRRTLEP